MFKVIRGRSQIGEFFVAMHLIWFDFFKMTLKCKKHSYLGFEDMHANSLLSLPNPPPRSSFSVPRTCIS